MAKDKQPNKALSIDLDKQCEYADCYNHGVKSRTTATGTIERRCIWHPFSDKPARNANDDYMLRFLGLI